MKPIRDAAVVVADTIVGLPLVSVAMAGVDLFGGVVGKVADEKRERAYRAFVDSWAAVGRMPLSEAEEEIRGLCRKGDRGFDDRLYEMFRSMVFSRCEAAWPYMARLTAEYQQQGKPSDAFFRRAGALLARCEEGDIRRLVVAANLTRDVLDRAKGARAPISLPLGRT